MGHGICRIFDAPVIFLLRVKYFFLYLFLLMSVKDCPRCGKGIPLDSSFCMYCGFPLSAQINTHSVGWMIMSFLVSLLWLKVNNTPLFPLGFIGGLVIAFWSADVDRAFGKNRFCHTPYCYRL